MYTVQFIGRGYTKPTAINPMGIHVTARGFIKVCGDRPNSSFNIPFDVIERCKQIFMEETGCFSYSGDSENTTCYPVVKLFPCPKRTKH